MKYLTMLLIMLILLAVFLLVRANHLPKQEFNETAKISDQIALDLQRGP